MAGRKVRMASLAVWSVAVGVGVPAAWGQEGGYIAAWGWNSAGQCSLPFSGGGFVAVAAGYEHSLGLKADGSVVAWGNSDSEYDVPAPNSGFVAIAAGGSHSLGLKADGSIATWGSNYYGQRDVPAPNPPPGGFVAVAGGGYHSLGLKTDGSIVAWGRNNSGQCNVPAQNSGFVAVAAGGYHSLGLRADGSIVAWGYNNYGQCNLPSPNSGFVAVAGGYYHSLGLKANGSIVAWGAGQPYQYASPHYKQCMVPAPNSGFVAVAGGYYHSLGLKADGSIVGWGRNNYGQCNVPPPNSGFSSISGGCLHSLAVSSVPNYSAATPAPISPTNGRIVGRTPTLQASAFFDPDGGTHANSQWQVDRNSDFSSPAWDSGEAYAASTQAAVPSGCLTFSTAYYWRVRYKDSFGQWTDWSSPVWRFTTAAEISPGAELRADRLMLVVNESTIVRLFVSAVGQPPNKGVQSVAVSIPADVGGVIRSSLPVTWVSPFDDPGALRPLAGSVQVNGGIRGVAASVPVFPGVLTAGLNGPVEAMSFPVTGIGPGTVHLSVQNYFGGGYAGIVTWGKVVGDESTYGGVTITVRLPGDVDGDGDVDTFDVIDVITAFGTVPGDPLWNPNCDFDGNGVVDVFDVAVVVSNFGAVGYNHAGTATPSVAGNAFLPANGGYASVSSGVGGEDSRTPSPIGLDGRADVRDINKVVNAFGSEPGNTNWNPGADFDRDGVVDIFDVIDCVNTFAGGQQLTR